jgi:hypothetical protein
MSSDEQTCERTSEGTSPGTRQPANFATVGASDTKNLGLVKIKGPSENIMGWDYLEKNNILKLFLAC